MNHGGHFFCEGRCDDVKPNMRHDDEDLVRCPDCQQLTCHWVPDREPVRERVQGSLVDPAASVPVESRARRGATAAKWFAEMHRVVEQAQPYGSAI